MVKYIWKPCSLENDKANVSVKGSKNAAMKTSRSFCLTLCFQNIFEHRSLFIPSARLITQGTNIAQHTLWVAVIYIFYTVPWS